MKTIKGYSRYTEYTPAKGFTLAELLVTLTIGGILLSVAVPGFQRLNENIRLDNTQRKITDFANLARLTALQEGAGTIVCGSEDGLGCNNRTQWRTSIIAFRDDNGNHERDSGENLLGKLPLHDEYWLGTRRKLEFNIKGAGYMGSWIHCPERPAARGVIKLIISLGGRIRSEMADASLCG